MKNENVQLITGKIVEEMTEAELDDRITAVESAIAEYESLTTKLESDLVILQGVKDSI